MRRLEQGFSIVDFLIIMAMAMILVGLLAPHFIKGRTTSNAARATYPAATSRPAR